MSADSKFVPDPSWPTIVELAIECWGQPNKALSSRDDVRFGDKGSKSVKPSALIWKDHESGEGGGYVEMWGLARRGAPLPPRETARPKPKPGNGHGGKVPPWENVGVIYHYHDAAGDLVLDVVRTRTGTPRFVQRAPDGFRDNGEPKWRWSVKHIPDHDYLLYRLPGLRASGDAQFGSPKARRTPTGCTMKGSSPPPTSAVPVSGATSAPRSSATSTASSCRTTTRQDATTPPRWRAR
jgi:hypothetical protein